MELVDGFDEAEDGECYQQEVDDCLDEVAVIDGCFGLGLGCRGDDVAKTCEIDAAEEQTDDGHNHIVDEGVDDGGKRTADDNAGSQVDDAAPGDEFLKFCNKTFFLCHGISSFFSFLKFVIESGQDAPGN